MSGPRRVPARVLVADDHVLVREGLKVLIEREPDLQVVAEASDGPEAVVKATTEEVDLVIMDVAMPRMTGLQATREIRRRRPTTLPVVILSMYDREQYFFDALAAGAAGYVLKRQVDRDVVDACRQAPRDRPFIYPAALRAVMQRYLEHLERGEQLGSGPLTPREAEVVKLIAEGQNSEEIARLLTISRKTVDRHRENILEKTRSPGPRRCHAICHPYRTGRAKVIHDPEFQI